MEMHELLSEPLKECTLVERICEFTEGSYCLFKVPKLITSMHVCPQCLEDDRGCC